MASSIRPDLDRYEALLWALDRVETTVYGTPPDTSDDGINDPALLRGIYAPYAST